MTKVGGVIVVILSLVAGFGGGYGYQLMNPAAKTGAASTAASSASTATTQTLAECLTSVWGKDKYAAITANSSLATTEDNFKALQCYQSK